MAKLFLISGPEEILAERAVERCLQESRVMSPEAVVTDVMSAEAEPGAISEALAPSLFTDDRIVILRDIQELGADLIEELSANLESLDDQVTLIVWHKGGVKGKALLEKIKKLGAEQLSAEAVKREGDKVEFVMNEFTRLGRKATPAAAKALVEALGSDLRELAAACAQLVSDIAPEQSIDVSAVDAMHQGRIETTGFDVADATLDGKVEIALATLRRAIDTGTEPVLIVSAIASALRTMGKVTEVNRSIKSFEVASQLGLAPWQIDKARRQLGGWSPVTLAAAITTIAETDAAIKGAESDPLFALERAVIAIATARK